MILINSLYVLPRHINKAGIIVYDNLQAQEIMKLNNKAFNTIYNISSQARANGFIYMSVEVDSIKKWYLKTKDTTIKSVMHYHNLFSTTYYLTELEYYRECPHCLCAVPTTWTICTVCGSKSLK